jgi:hypothetical protein
MDPTRKISELNRPVDHCLDIASQLTDVYVLAPDYLGRVELVR